MRVGILEPDCFSDVARQRLSALGPVIDYDRGDLSQFVANKDALFVRFRHHIGVELLRKASHLRYLCSPTTGHTHIDLDALTSRGITLLSLKGENAFLERIRAAPEHTIGLILALLRNYRSAFLDVFNDHWDRYRCYGEELAGMPVGLVGFGRIGRRVASYLMAFDSLLGCFDPSVSEVPSGVRQYPTLEALISAHRVVVLAASYESNTTPIINRDLITALAGKFFINIARGELVDENALLDSVEQGRLAGCAVDVICNETGKNNHARWIAATQARNVIVTPHIGGATFASIHATEEFIADKLISAVGLR